MKRVDREDLIEEIIRLSNVVDGSPTLKNLKEHGKYSKSPYEREFGTWRNAVKSAGLNPIGSGGHNKISDEDVLREINKVAEELGRPPTSTEVDEHSEISATSVYHHFGSFENGLIEAGFDPNSTHRLGKGKKQIPDEVLLSDLRAGAKVIGRPPTRSEIDDFGEFSSQVYVNRFGSWKAAIQAAGLGEELPEWRRNLMEAKTAESNV